MFANGYVGTTEDAQRVRKLDKQREQQRKKFEELQEKKKREAAGLRQFGSSKAETYEAAFKTETVGLVTRKEFIEKRATIQERLEEDEARERQEAEAAAAAEKERRRKEKEKKRAKAKLSFAADVSVAACVEGVEAERLGRLHVFFTLRGGADAHRQAAHKQPSEPDCRGPDR
jgi:protein FAM50